MNGREKSDSAEVAVKPANKTGMPAAEQVEPRAGTEGNAIPQSTSRTQGRADASQARDRIRVAARRNKKEKFTALLHHVTPEALRDAFYAIAKNAAAGIEGITWRDYEADLERDLRNLVSGWPADDGSALRYDAIEEPAYARSVAQSDDRAKQGGCAVRTVHASLSVKRVAGPPEKHPTAHGST